jgi:hypothetical protein
MGKGVIWWLALAVGTMAQLCLSPASESATATATPTSYKITFTLNFRNQATQVFTTGAVTATDLDIVGVIPGANVSNVFVNIPTGVYDNARVIMNCAVRLQGSVTSGGTTYVTTSGGGTATSGAAVEGPYNFPSNVCTPPSVTIVPPNDFDPPLRIDGRITITFNAADSLQLNGTTLSAGTFSANMTVP